MLTIDEGRCNGCGTCAQVCPRYVPELEKGGKARVCLERVHLCMGCGQCAAVCAQDAIAVEGLPAAALVPVVPHAIGPGAMLALLEQRRSVRRFQARPVPREVLDQIAEGAHRAPPADGRPAVGLVVVDEPAKLKEISRLSYQLYAGLQQAMQNPLGRIVVGLKVGKARRDTLTDFVLPAMLWYQRWYAQGRDEIRRDAPALMLFHAPRRAAMADESCLLAAFHAVLVAETLGVGTCLNGLLPAACTRSPELRGFLGLPPTDDVFAAVLLGYGKFRYRKAIRRRLTAARYL